jgi:hypothetical protein
MVSVLKVIFGLDAVAGELGVARQRLVFFEQLGGIAALAIILAIAGSTAHSLGALSTAATTTAALTIVDQLAVSLSHWRRSNRSPQIFPSTEVVPRRSGPARTDWCKSTLPCRQPHGWERGDFVGGRWRERIIFVRAVPSLHPDVMGGGPDSKPF